MGKNDRRNPHPHRVGGGGTGREARLLPRPPVAFPRGVPAAGEGVPAFGGEVHRPHAALHADMKFAALTRAPRLPACPDRRSPRGPAGRGRRAPCPSGRGVSSARDPTGPSAPLPRSTPGDSGPRNRPRPRTPRETPGCRSTRPARPTPSPRAAGGRTLPPGMGTRTPWPRRRAPATSRRRDRGSRRGGPRGAGRPSSDPPCPESCNASPRRSASASGTPRKREGTHEPAHRGSCVRSAGRRTGGTPPPPAISREAALPRRRTHPSPRGKPPPPAPGRSGRYGRSPPAPPPRPLPPRKAKQRREHGDVVDTCDIAPRYGPRDVVAGKGEEGYLPRHRRENPGLPEQVPRGHGTVRQESDPDTGGAMLRLERLPERRGHRRDDPVAADAPCKGFENVFVEPAHPGGAVEHPVQVDAHDAAPPTSTRKNGTAAFLIAV